MTQLVGATYGQPPLLDIRISDEMPPDCPDPQFFCTKAQLMERGKDIDLDTLLPLAQKMPPFAPNTEVKTVRYFHNERLVCVWEEGLITYRLWFPQGTWFETITMEINGELATVETFEDKGTYQRGDDIVQHIESHPALSRLKGVELDLDLMVLKNKRRSKFLGIF